MINYLLIKSFFIFYKSLGLKLFSENVESTGYYNQEYVDCEKKREFSNKDKIITALALPILFSICFIGCKMVDSYCSSLYNKDTFIGFLAYNDCVDEGMTLVFRVAGAVLEALLKASEDS